MQFKTFYTLGLYAIFFKQKYISFKIARDLQPHKISFNMQYLV